MQRVTFARKSHLKVTVPGRFQICTTRYTRGYSTSAVAFSTTGCKQEGCFYNTLSRSQTSIETFWIEILLDPVTGKRFSANREREWNDIELFMQEYVQAGVN